MGNKPSRGMSYFLGWVTTLVLMIVLIYANSGTYVDWLVVVMIIHLVSAFWIPKPLVDYPKERVGLFFACWGALSGGWFIEITLVAVAKWIRSGGIGRTIKAIKVQLATKQ